MQLLEGEFCLLLKLCLQSMAKALQASDSLYSGIIPPSSEEYQMLGLNLLRLLVHNRIAEFHAELELPPVKALEHPCIKHSVELEQSIKGAYNRVLSSDQELQQYII